MTGKSFDLQRIVIRCLVLLVCSREKVCAWLRTAQIEIDGNLLLSPVSGSRSRTFRDHSISVLVASDPHEVLAGEAETRQDDRQVDARCREQYRLQLPWLLAAIGGRVPEIDSLGDGLRLARALLFSALVSRQREQSWRRGRCTPRLQVPRPASVSRLALLPEHQ